MFSKNLLIKIMEEKNFTAYKLWKESKVAQSTISTILNGDNKNPTTATLEKLANALDVSISQFFNDEISDELNASNQKQDVEEFDEETRAIARGMKNLSPNKKKLLKDLIKTMTEAGDEELNK